MKPVMVVLISQHFTDYDNLAAVSYIYVASGTTVVVVIEVRKYCTSYTLLRETTFRCSG
jgi:hypothetical protein